VKVLEGEPSTWPDPERRTAVTVGVYDGVHLGHRRVLGDLGRMAAAGDLVITVVTFREHPLLLLAPDRMPPQLTTVEQRLELFETLGVDQVALLDFDDRLRRLPPEAFVDRILVDGLGAAVVVVGTDFRFGYRQEGDLALLQRLGTLRGFEVAPVTLEGDGSPYSSTRIRTALSVGDVATAELLLGRRFQIRGTVVEGDGRGRELGFPTANLRLADHQAVPAHGVYAVLAGVGSADHAGVANIGVRPTFDGVRLVVEVHLLEMDVDLYGDELRVDLVARIRDERRFEAIDALVTQIAADVAAAGRILRDQAGVESIS
jgi:riboflavin kinase/FMN adenylyltransferase